MENALSTHTELSPEAPSKKGTIVMDLAEILAKNEELHPDLMPYLNTTSNWQVLQHPLVYSVPYFSQNNAFLNAQYAHKKSAIKKALEEEDWDRYLSLHERPYRIDAFVKIRIRLHGQAYWERVSWLWSDSENIWQNLSVWRRIWQSREPDRHFVMDKEEREVLRDMPDNFVVYRGVKHKSAILSLSWTLNRDKAVWFAKRMGRPNKKPLLATATIQKSAVLAYLAGRNEQEIVLNPRGLRKLSVVTEGVE